MPRAFALLLAFSLSALFVLKLDQILDGGTVFRRVFFPAPKDALTGPAWPNLVQTLIVLLGLPVGYLLWHWRDANVRAGIDNQRKDTNLQEFQEVQLRAAGALSKDLESSARATLQIAALHQLRGYLRGEYGTSFKRPAFELYCAMLEHRSANDDAAILEGESETKIEHSVFRTVRLVIAEEWEPFFRSGFPLRGRKLRHLHLNVADLSNLDLSDTDLSGGTFTVCEFRETQLEGAQFFDCRFTRSNLAGANLLQSTMTRCAFVNSSLAFTRCRRATISGCSFLQSDLVKSDFAWSSFDDVQLQSCIVVEADFVGVKATRVDMTDMHFDKNTTLFDLDAASAEGKSPKLIREQWLSAGAVDVSEPDVPRGTLLIRWARSVKLVQGEDSLVGWIPDYLI